MCNSKAKAAYVKRFFVFPLAFLNFHTKLTQKLQDKTSVFHLMTPVFTLENKKKPNNAKVLMSIHNGLHVRKWESKCFSQFICVMENLKWYGEPGMVCWCILSQ